MRTYKLLMDWGFREAAQSMCAILRAELSVIDPQPVRRSQNLRLFQIDIPDPSARLIEETARRREISSDTLLLDWIERCAKEAGGAGLAGRAEDAGGGKRALSILEKCRLLAEWRDLGYHGDEEGIKDLTAKLARD